MNPQKLCLTDSCINFITPGQIRGRIGTFVAIDIVLECLLLTLNGVGLYVLNFPYSLVFVLIVSIVSVIQIVLSIFLYFASKKDDLFRCNIWAFLTGIMVLTEFVCIGENNGLEGSNVLMIVVTVILNLTVLVFHILMLHCINIYIHELTVTENRRRAIVTNILAHECLEVEDPPPPYPGKGEEDNVITEEPPPTYSSLTLEVPAVIINMPENNVNNVDAAI